MCIGNIEGGDDAVGPYVFDILKNNEDENLYVVNCGTVPENYTSIVKRESPKNLLIIDAVDMNLNHGDIKIVPKEKIGEMTISTHGIPLSVLINYLEQYIKNIILIGIQPKAMSGKMTDIVKKSADRLIETIKKKEIDKLEILE